jgi:pectinesterase
MGLFFEDFPYIILIVKIMPISATSAKKSLRSAYPNMRNKEIIELPISSFTPDKFRKISLNFKILIFLLLHAWTCFSQKFIFPIDTSFSLYSAYQKEVKNYPLIKPVKANVPSSVVVKNELTYATYEEREMHIDIYSPANLNGPKPVILFIHGGGWRSGNKNMDAPMAIGFAQKGYIAATVEYRLSPEAPYPAALFDIKTAIRWLRKNARELNIEPEKMAIAGTSAGGQLAALVASTNGSVWYVDPTRYTLFSSDVQAVIVIDGILAFIHPESGEGVDQPDKPSAATQWFGFPKNEKPGIWNEASALTNAGKTFPPVLFINSQHPRFHAGRDDLIARLDSLGIYSEVHTIQDTPHTFWLFDPWFEITTNYCLQFLNKQFDHD